MRCDDPKIATMAKLVDADSYGHSWIVIEWESVTMHPDGHTYTVTYSSGTGGANGGGGFNGGGGPGGHQAPPTSNTHTKVTKLMCQYCKKIEHLTI